MKRTVRNRRRRETRHLALPAMEYRIITIPRGIRSRRPQPPATIWEASLRMLAREIRASWRQLRDLVRDLRRKGGAR
jgi:hypothetical protein